jgi:hypothetical protein
MFKDQESRFIYGSRMIYLFTRANDLRNNSSNAVQMPLTEIPIVAVGAGEAKSSAWRKKFIPVVHDALAAPIRPSGSMSEVVE